jgi:RNA polymerase sigma factor (sigma-70 family)
MAEPPDLALVSLCEREHPRLVGALSLYCGDDDLARELAQEVIARTCRAWPKVISMEAPGAWMHRVAMNLANSAARRAKAGLRASHRSDPVADIHNDADVATVVALRAALQLLPLSQRSVLVLRYYLDLGVREVADVLGCPEGTVKTLTSRGIAALRSSGLVGTEEICDVR